jgi:beta-xylosidase
MSTRRSFLGKAGAAVAASLIRPLKGAAKSAAAADPGGDSPPAYRNVQLSVEARVKDLLGRMTLEEKAAQTVSTFLDRKPYLDLQGNYLMEQVKPALKNGTGEITRPGVTRDPHATAVACNLLQKFLVEETRLGIPAIIHEESLHGLMCKGATSFPQAIALASTWNPALVEKVFSAAAAEGRARGAHQVLTPVLGVARDPRWGRTQETYGEDPYLASRFAVACVKGFQGEGPTFDHRHVISTVKHFAVHSQPQGGQNIGPCNYSLRTIYEFFLPPFRAALTEAKAQAVMAAYSEIDGTPCHANRWLLQKVLREEFGFQGIVVSDYLGVPFLQEVHHVAANKQQAAKKAIEAGVDVELPYPDCYTTLAEQVRTGTLAEATLDRAVGRVLRLKFLLGLFENPYVDPEEAVKVSSDPAHAQLAAQAARQAITLLKNQGALLPLDPAKIGTLAVIGPNAAECHLGDYAGEPPHTVSILEGIRQKAGSKFKVEYAEGCQIIVEDKGPDGKMRKHVPDPADSRRKIAEAAAVARRADVVLLVVGGNELTCNEAVDRDSLEMFGPQDDLVKAVAAVGKPTIVFLINGRPLAIHDIAENVPAILEGWFLGQDTGNAVADVIFGDDNPAGKLPITFPRSVGEVPDFYNYKPSAHRRGYLLVPHGPLFPFGHGLSYTTFEYGNLQLAPSSIRPEGQTTVSVDVKNTGGRAGGEVVQLYIRDEVSSVTRPVKELKGFERIHLEPGETRTVKFKLTPAELRFLNEDMKWVVEPGDFKIMVGTSSVSYQTAVLHVRESLLS